MSDRGSILISTANDIGEALVEKLGGEGYAPSAWDKEYNKLGIAEVDSAPALSVLEDSSSAEPARGSILLSTANAIGAVLNKKYYTDRGFKPKEWASAAFKLAPLPEKSAESSPICAIEDGADDVPLKSCEVALSASIDGYSSVDVVQTGKNLLPSLVDGVYEGNGVKAVVVGGVATLSGTTTSSGNAFSIPLTHEFVTPTQHAYIHFCNSAVNTSAAPSFEDSSDVGNTNVSASFSPVNRVYSIPSEKRGVTWNRVRFYLGSGVTLSGTFSPMVCYENTASSYEPYVAPTTYTASLGRTIYGGQVDIVSGTGTDGYKKITLNSLLDGLTMTQIGTAGVYRVRFNLSDAKGAANTTVFSGLCDYYTPSTANQTYTQNEGIAINTSGQCFIYDSRFNTSASLNDFKTWIDANPVNLCYELATGSDFTFTGQEIPTKDGYNAFWSDQGNTALDYYGAPEPYTRGTASGAIANVQSARTDLPFTMVKANIAPNLAGVESVEVTKTGKNLLHITDGTFSIGNTGATATILNGEISVNGTTVNSGGRTTRLSDYFILRAGTYYISPVISTSPYVHSYLNKKSDNSVVGYSSGSAFTVAEDTEVYFGINLENEKTYDTTLSPQLEVGSSATEYTPYEEPTVYTADLGRTVYGGYADIVNGTGTDENGNDFTFNGQVVRVSPGVNNLWNNAGGDTDVEYFTQE